MSSDATVLRFAQAAHRLAEVCRARGLVTPGFRSPPGLASADRTLRRRADGGVIVAVRVRGRPHHAVLVDLVEGVIASNSIPEPEAETVRQQLLDAVGVPPPAQAA